MSYYVTEINSFKIQASPTLEKRCSLQHLSQAYFWDESCGEERGRKIEANEAGAKGLVSKHPVNR